MKNNDSNMDSSPKESNTESSKEKLTAGQVFLSVIQAAVGIQSNKNRERDFSQGDISSFIIAGIIFTVLFVVILLGIVNLII